MRFIDEVEMKLMGGHGGSGCVSFRRETFVPRGGPDGGEGGKGGDIIFECNPQLSTLRDFRYRKVNLAPPGLNGQGSQRSGKDGKDIILRVPVGTLVRDLESGKILFDFIQAGQRWLACKGGRGGKGNTHFTSSTFQAPKFAQPGEAGDSLKIRLELKILADVGIIGFPNAGKSSLTAKMSAAKPKIADYSFTTLVPHLGVVTFEGMAPFVIADVPGLIRNSHLGVGLGHRFLKHIERTKLLIHVIEWNVFHDSVSVSDYVNATILRYKELREELRKYNKDLCEKPEMIVLNKSDLLPHDLKVRKRIIARCMQRLKEEKLAEKKLELEMFEGNSLGEFGVCREVNPINISTISGENIPHLIEVVGLELAQSKKFDRLSDVSISGGTKVLLPDHPLLKVRKVSAFAQV